jgi:hypothetical protein
LFTNVPQRRIEEFRVEYLAKLVLSEAGRKWGLGMQ